jgi:ADP-ribose pyrophosphatase YjhB (NUDIX family)
MSQTHFSGKVAANAVIAKDGRVLMTRDHRDEKIWGLPGGRLSLNEPLEDALKREVSEELGVAIEIGRFVCSQQAMHMRDLKPQLFLAFESKIADPAAEFSIPSEEVAEIKWVGKEVQAGFERMVEVG